MELGLFSFAEVPPGQTQSSRLRDLVEEIELADQLGLDVFGVGEHHRPDYASSAPAVVLAAAASRTERIRLTSAVTVLTWTRALHRTRAKAVIEGTNFQRLVLSCINEFVIKSFF